MAAEETQSEFQIDIEQLYHEEVFTDRRAGSILRLTPVTSDGTRDSRRAVVFLGQTQVLTQAGALPINFELQVDSLEQAAAQFEQAAAQAVDDTLEQLKQLQREAASSIVVPGGDSSEATGQGALGGGILGGGAKRR